MPKASLLLWTTSDIAAVSSPTDHEASVPLRKANAMVDAHRMRFIGVDLAWADSAVANETGVVALDEDGTVVAAGWTAGVGATTAWLEANAGEEGIAFIDAPLVVLNESKQRLCEKQVGQRYGRWKVSANSTNRASPRLAGVLLRVVLERRGWTYDDGVGGGRPDADRSFSECYPYTTLVGAEEFGYQQERPLYKRKPCGVSAAHWRPLRAVGCDELIKRLDLLREASPALHLRSHPTTAQLVLEPSPINDAAYKHREDLIDACLAVWTAGLWWSAGLERVQVLGAADPLVDARGARATIIAPARSEQRLSSLAGL
jgi:predicted RNase H-like nuclease